jgi:hypothetical protein
VHPILASPATVGGVNGGQFLGTISVSGLALGAVTALILGVRGSDRIKINTKDKAAWWGIITGTLCIAAEGTWADLATTINSLPTSAFSASSGLGNPEQGGIALFLTLCAFGPRWKKLIWPALFGIAASVTYATAGGVWGILVNFIRVPIGQLAS